MHACTLTLDEANVAKDSLKAPSITKITPEMDHVPETDFRKLIELNTFTKSFPMKSNTAFDISKVKLS